MSGGDERRRKAGHPEPRRTAAHHAVDKQRCKALQNMQRSAKGTHTLDETPRFFKQRLGPQPSWSGCWSLDDWTCTDGDILERLDRRCSGPVSMDVDLAVLHFLGASAVWRHREGCVPLRTSASRDAQEGPHRARHAAPAHA